MTLEPDTPAVNPGMNILAVNPGSTSTKLALFDAETEFIAFAAEHPSNQLSRFEHVADQLSWRLSVVRKFMTQKRIEIKGMRAVIARGGLLKPIPGGVYSVNAAMLDDLRNARYGEHASNLGALLAYELTAGTDCPAFIADPVVVDEMDDTARISGLPGLERRSIFHALNQKSVARETARILGKTYEQCNFIVAHMGGGISVGAHSLGRVVDVNNALDGDGPFAPERTGGLPAGQLAQLCFSGIHTFEEIRKKLTGSGGLAAYRASNSFTRLKEAMAQGDAQARLLFAALAYQVSKEIAMHGATLSGKVDAIILTGGLARDTDLVERIRERVSFLAPIHVIPGEREMAALAQRALAVLMGREKPREYA